MAQSGFIVRVPEAEKMVSGLRDRYDPAARLGVPAHITVLFPFMAPETIDASVVKRIMSVVRDVPSFAFSLATTARFPATAYLEPEPAAPFIVLTERLTQAFPHYLPFAGAFPSIIPHLTVAHGTSADAEIAQTALNASLAVHGPITAVCHSVVLIENTSGTWKQMHVFPCGRFHTDT